MLMGDNTAVSLSGLFRFGMACLAAHQHPGDHHTFIVFTCPDCGLQPLALRIEHHTGSKKGDFKGMIFARCSACDREERVFSFTGEHRSPLREECPVCDCGHAHFLVAKVERIEGAPGLPGFFDEGVIVGECAQCGRRRAFVATD